MEDKKMLTACKQYSLAIPKAFGTTKGNITSPARQMLFSN
jgi:hypothetical protein